MIIKQILCILILVCLLITANSCATIISGRSQNLPVTSVPTGAIVTIAGQKQITPATFLLDKRQEYVVRVEKEGYESVEIVLKKGISGWVFGNIIFGLYGIIGVIIDIATGSASKFEPSKIEANLVAHKLGLKNLDGKAVLVVKLVESKPRSDK